MFNMEFDLDFVNLKEEEGLEEIEEGEGVNQSQWKQTRVRFWWLCKHYHKFHFKINAEFLLM